MNKSIASPALRHVDPAFLDSLTELAASSQPVNWWRDVLANDDLFIAIRRNSINVYYRGASVFKIDWLGDRLIPSTHAKYLARQTQTYIPLIDGQFEYQPDALNWRHYEGPETLRQMIQATRPFSGPEKAGLHPLVVGDPAVLDVEIALTRSAEDQLEGEELATQRQDRLDAAVVLNTPAGPSIRFYEAKHFANAALRANGDNLPAVIGQIQTYETALTKYSASLANGYVQTAKALVQIERMRQQIRNEETSSLSPFITQIAESGTLPLIDSKPHLLIFGFDKAQRDDPAWRKHLDKLHIQLDGRVRAIGNPSRKTVAFR